MSAKMSNDDAETPLTAIIPRPAKKTNKGNDIVLPEDVWSVIVTFVDWRGFQALACACKATRDAARDVDWLARDKVYVLRCWLVFGGNEDTLRRSYWDDGWKMRDEPSDTLSEWFGVRVEGGRVTKLHWEKEWIDEPLKGTIPAEIGALDGLTLLYLDSNQISGHLPLEIGRLTSLIGLSLSSNRLEGPIPAELGALTALTRLHLHKNNFTGELPSTLVNLTNLEIFSLHGNNFDTDVPSYGNITNKVQTYLATLKPSYDMLG